MNIFFRAIPMLPKHNGKAELDPDLIAKLKFGLSIIVSIHN